MANARGNNTEREQFGRDLRKELEMSPWTSGEAGWLLNMAIKHDWARRALHLSQPLTIEQVAGKLGLTGQKGKKPHIPIKPDLKLVKAGGDQVVPGSVFPYQSVVGGLL